MSELLQSHGVENDFEFVPVGYWTSRLRGCLALELDGASVIGRGNVTLAVAAGGDPTVVKIANERETKSFIVPAAGLTISSGGNELSETASDNQAHKLIHVLGYDQGLIGCC